MGLRFRKSFSFGPLARVWLTTRGVSLSLGPRGTTVSIGQSGVHANVGVPGTGLSWRERLGPKRMRAHVRTLARVAAEATPMNWHPWLWLIAGILMLAAITVYPDLRASWELGGPGARHAEDIDPTLRATWGERPW